MAAGIILRSSPKSSLKISLCIGLIFVHGLIPSIVCQMAPPPWRAIPEWSLTQKDYYPNPMTHPDRCRPLQETPSPSKLCDPNNMLPNETATELDGFLDANARTCVCTVNGSFENCNFFSVAVMKKTSMRDHFSTEEKKAIMKEFASYFLETWRSDGCSADVIIVISVIDTMISEAVNSKVLDLIEKGSCRNAMKRVEEVKQRLIGLDEEHFVAKINLFITNYSYILSTDHPCRVTSRPTMTAVTAAGTVSAYTVTEESNSGTTVSLWYLAFTFVCMSRSFI